VPKIAILLNLELLEKLQIPLRKSGGDSHHHFQKIGGDKSPPSHRPTKLRLCKCTNTMRT